MSGYITKQTINYVLEVYGQRVADMLAESKSLTFIDFLIENNLIWRENEQTAKNR